MCYIQIYYENLLFFSVSYICVKNKKKSYKYSKKIMYVVKYKYNERKRNVYEKEKRNIPDSVNNNDNSSNNTCSNDYINNK